MKSITLCIAALLAALTLFTGIAVAEPVTLVTSSKIMEQVPVKVIPLAEKPLLSLSDLEVTAEGDEIKGSFRFMKTNEDPFTVVLFFTSGEDYLVCYLDLENKFFLCNQTDQWVQLFEQGCAISGNANAGLVTFTMKKKAEAPGNMGAMQTIYDLNGLQGKFSVFTVKGVIQFMAAMPGEQTDPEAFHANSNIVEAEAGF